MEMRASSRASLTRGERRREAEREPACPAAILAVCVCVCVCVCVFVFSTLTSFSIHLPPLIVSFLSRSLGGAGCQDQL